MKKLLLALALIWALPAQAQITNHAQPIGRGSGVIGWGIAGPCSANQWLVYLTGTGADPSCASAGSAFGVQSANTVFAGPATAPSANPTFRALVGADLPLPTGATLGAVFSKTATASNWLRSLGTDGVFTTSQPAFTDISGTIATGQVSGSYTGITGVGTLTVGTWNATAITGANIATNTITYSNQAQATANTMSGNWTGSTANKADNAMPSCAASGTNHLNYVSGTGITCGTNSTLVLLNTLTASNSASLSDTTSLTATYSNYLIVLTNIIPASANQTLQLLVHTGGSFPSTNYVSQTVSFVGSTVTAAGSVTTSIPLNQSGAAVAAEPGISGTIRVGNVASTSVKKQFYGQTTETNAGAAAKLYQITGWWNNGDGAVDGVQFLMTSGNITSGTIQIYGVQ